MDRLTPAETVEVVAAFEEAPKATGIGNVEAVMQALDAQTKGG